MPRTNLLIANSTSVPNNYPAILCPSLPVAVPFNRDDVLDAVILHIAHTQVYKIPAAFSMDFPPYRAVFKSEVYKQDIRALLGNSNMFPTRSGKLSQLVCVRTQEEAELYGLALWHLCANTPSIVYISRGALFLCPSWSRLPTDKPAPDPNLCPAVRDNMFASNAEETLFPVTRSTIITNFALALYSRDHIVSQLRLEWPISLLNVLFSASASAAAYGDNRCYHLYLLCKSDLIRVFIFLLVSNVNTVTRHNCLDVPDFRKPPWSGPHGLIANYTSNATVDHRLSLPSVGPGSSLQETTPDLDSTS